MNAIDVVIARAGRDVGDVAEVLAEAHERVPVDVNVKEHVIDGHLVTRTGAGVVVLEVEAVKVLREGAFHAISAAT